MVIQTVPPPLCPVTGYMTALLILVGLVTFKVVARAHETHSRMKSGQRLKLINFVFTTSEFRRNLQSQHLLYSWSTITSSTPGGPGIHLGLYLMKGG